MTTPLVSRAIKLGSFALMLVGLLMMGRLGNADDNKHQKPANQPSAPTPRATAPAPRPSAPAPRPSAPVSRPSAPFSGPSTPAAPPPRNTGGSTPGGNRNPGATNPGGTNTPGGSNTPGAFTPGGNRNPGGTNPSGANTPGGNRNPGSSNTPGAITPGGNRNPGGSNTPGAFTPGGNRNPGETNPSGANTPGGNRNPGGSNTPGAFTPGGNRNPGETNPSGANTPGGNRNPGGSNTPGAFTPGGNRSPGGSNTPGGTNNAGPNGRNGGGPHPGNFNGGRPTPTHNPVINTPPARGSRDNFGRNGSGIRVRPNGRVSDVHDVKRGMDIHQGLNGGRRIIETRPDHSHIVYQKGRPGYVERPYSYRGHNFDRRTYSYHGRSYNHFYHGYRYHGVDMHVYAPSRYYGRAYYGWAYNPWSSPIRYRWGWMDNPWHRHYGYYFNPYPVYPSAAFWLTDYLISSSLQSAYAAQQDAGEVDGDPAMGAAPLTPEVKQMIADEVRNQLALENQEAQQNAQQQDVDPGSSGIARILNDVANGHAHVFVVGTALDVVDGSGTECTLTDGDALSMRTAPPPDATAAEVVVLASKGGQECPKGDVVAVGLDDLQEMLNHMRETIDQGLQELQDNQGKGGLPVAPASPQVAPAAYASIAPPSDPNAANELQQEAQQADQAQTEVSSEVAQDDGGAANARTISIGQSMAEVESILGQPTNKANLGNRIIYNYNGMRVTFVAGRVTDVQ